MSDCKSCQELSELLLCCNMVVIGNKTNTVRIEFGNVGKEGLSKIVSHEGTLPSLISALRQCAESTDHKGNK